MSAEKIHINPLALKLWPANNLPMNKIEIRNFCNNHFNERPSLLSIFENYKEKTFYLNFDEKEKVNNLLMTYRKDPEKFFLKKDSDDYFNYMNIQRSTYFSTVRPLEGKEEYVNYNKLVLTKINKDIRSLGQIYNLFSTDDLIGIYARLSSYHKYFCIAVFGSVESSMAKKKEFENSELLKVNYYTDLRKKHGEIKSQVRGTKDGQELPRVDLSEFGVKL